MSELASKERLFYYQLALIWQAVLVPLLQSGNSSNIGAAVHVHVPSINLDLLF